MILKRAVWSLLILVAAHAAMAVEYAEDRNLSVSGPVSSVDVAQKLVRLYGDTVTLDASQASIRGLAGPIALEELAAGMSVTATFLPRPEVYPPDTPLPARSINVYVPPAGTIAGEVWQVNVARGTFTILGQEIQTTPDTQFEGSVYGNAIDGVRWLIPNITFVVELAEGSPLTALRVTALPPKPSQVIITQGTLHSVDGNRWTVIELGGRMTTFVVPEGTEVVNGPVQPADTVIVHARIEPGSNLANRIEVLRVVPSGPCAGPSLRLNGALTARTADSISVDVERRGPTTLRVTAATRFHGDPQPGDRVYVEGDYDAQGGLTARNVVKQIVHPAPMIITIEGTITAKDGSNAAKWTVGEYTVYVFESTTIVGTPVIGDRVRVRGVTAAGSKVISANLIEEL